MDAYSQSLALQPQFSLAYYHRAECWQQLRAWEPAIEDYSRLLDLEPQHGAAFCGRGLCHAARGDHAAALADFDQALRIDPRSSIALGGRSQSFAATRQLDRALADQIEALRLAPQLWEAYLNFARFWLTVDDATVRDPAMAVELATHACEITTWREWTCLELLSHATAEMGRWDEAQRHLARAYEMAPTDRQPDLARQLAAYARHEYRSES